MTDEEADDFLNGQVRDIDFEEDARRFAPNGYLLDTCALLWVANEPERLIEEGGGNMADAE